MLEAVLAIVPAEKLAGHYHDSNHRALDNIEASLALGIRTFDALIGRVDLLDTRKGIAHWKARGLDFSRVLHAPAAPASVDDVCGEEVRPRHGHRGHAVVSGSSRRREQVDLATHLRAQRHPWSTIAATLRRCDAATLRRCDSATS